MKEVKFYGDELYTVGAALEIAMDLCERDRKYTLADQFAELYRRVDEVVRGKDEKE